MWFFGNAVISGCLTDQGRAVSFAVEDQVDQAADRAEHVGGPQLAWQGLAVANPDRSAQLCPQLRAKPEGLVRTRQRTMASWSLVSSPSNLVVGWIFSISRAMPKTVSTSWLGYARDLDSAR